MLPWTSCMGYTLSLVSQLLLQSIIACDVMMVGWHGSTSMQCAVLLLGVHADDAGPQQDTQASSQTRLLYSGQSRELLQCRACNEPRRDSTTVLWTRQRSTSNATDDFAPSSCYRRHINPSSPYHVADRFANIFQLSDNKHFRTACTRNFRHVYNALSGARHFLDIIKIAHNSNRIIIKHDTLLTKCFILWSSF